MNLLTGLVLVSFASMMTWELLRFITPADIPVRLAPFIVVFLCLIWSSSLNLPVIFAFAGGCGVALMNRITGASGIEPWKIPELRNKKKKIHITRIPDLPPSMGRRISDL